MFHRTVFVSLLVSPLLLISACASHLPSIASEKPNQRPTLVDAPSEGVYGLFITGQADPLLRFALNKSEKIGFELSLAGVVGSMQIDQIYAVAGQHRFPIDAGKTYEWRKL